MTYVLDAHMGRKPDEVGDVEGSGRELGDVPCGVRTELEKARRVDALRRVRTLLRCLMRDRRPVSERHARYGQSWCTSSRKKK